MRSGGALYFNSDLKCLVSERGSWIFGLRWRLAKVVRFFPDYSPRLKPFNAGRTLYTPLVKTGL